VIRGSTLCTIVAECLTCLLHQVLDELEAAYPETAIGDTHPDKLYPLPTIDTQSRRAHKPHTKGWQDCIRLHEKNQDSMYLPLAAPSTGGEHIHGKVDSVTGEVVRDRDAKIVLRDVDVCTPRGECICNHLSVEVNSTNSLIISGRNASGKTSLVRVLSGLWPHSAGEVHVPTPSNSRVPGLKDVFIVPQRIHMFLGTLADQVTYPISIDPSLRTAAQEDQLMTLLNTVGIAYLVNRWAGDAEGVRDENLGLDCVARWEDVLSLGEQQRLSLARMFFHQPNFAVLDECTSAVSVDVEQKLYASAHAAGTSCVTISQRLSLPEFHRRELRVGVNNERGWSLDAVTTTEFSDCCN
jgi:ABC-type uncharacterized transport system fused permease/ATPase subunit